MPVLLDAIPDKAAKVPRPDTRRWLLFWHLSCQGDCVSALELDDGANRFYFLVYRAGITLLHMGTFFLRSTVRI